MMSSKVTPVIEEEGMDVDGANRDGAEREGEAAESDCRDLNCTSLRLTVAASHDKKVVGRGKRNRKMV